MDARTPRTPRTPQMQSSDAEQAGTNPELGFVAQTALLLLMATAMRKPLEAYGHSMNL